MKEELEECIETYLEVESVLNEFFGLINHYCYEECLTQKVNKYDFINPGYVGCCLKSYYEDHHPNWFNLFKRRVEKYGEPEGEGFCRYHTIDKGCILEDHKSPTCISYICPSLQMYLEEEYGVEYNWPGVKSELNEILSGKANEEEIEELKSDIKGHIEKIRSLQTIS
jgi:hypothetical protein